MLFKAAHLHFILDSTLSKSLNPIPQGCPGVASNMNLPNSGWKCGGSSPSLPVVRHTSSCRTLNHTHWSPVSLPLPEPDFHNSSSLASDFRISAWARDSRDFFAASSRATTRYSTYRGGCRSAMAIGKYYAGQSNIPHRPKEEHRVLCLVPCANWQVIANHVRHFEVCRSRRIEQRRHTSIPH